MVLRTHSILFKSTVLIIFLSFFIAGCTLRRDIFAPKDASPRIESVQTIKMTDGTNMATISFRIGEKGNFIVVASDVNKDIEILYVKGFAPQSTYQNPSLESGPVRLMPQTKKIASYSLPEPIEFPGLPGKWRIDIQVKDKENNMSNVYTIYAIVR